MCSACNVKVTSLCITVWIHRHWELDLVPVYRLQYRGRSRQSLRSGQCCVRRARSRRPNSVPVSLASELHCGTGMMALLFQFTATYTWTPPLIIRV